MIKKLTKQLALLITIGSQATANVEDIPSSNRQIGYVCDGKIYTIIKTEMGWALLSEPDVEVSTTYDGFMLTDQKSGAKRSLGKLASGVDVLYVYHENDTKRYVCSLALRPRKPADR